MKVRVTFEADIIPSSESNLERLIGAQFYIIPDTFYVESLPMLGVRRKPVTIESGKENADNGEIN